MARIFAWIWGGKMKKIIALLLLSLSLIGCTNKYRDISAEELSNNILSVIDKSNYSKGDSKKLKRFYGLNSSDYEDFALYLPSSAINVNEFLIIKVKNDKQVDEIEESVDARINKQIANFNGYSPENIAYLEDYYLTNIGQYVFFVVGEDSEKIADEFKKSIKY